jgi:hypothetical protein
VNFLVFWVLSLVQGVHIRVRENYVKIVQGVHLKSLLSSYKRFPGGHTRTNSTSEEGKTMQGFHIIVVEHSKEDIPKLLNTLRDLHGVH